MNPAVQRTDAQANCGEGSVAFSQADNLIQPVRVVFAAAQPAPYQTCLGCIGSKVTSNLASILAAS